MIYLCDMNKLIEIIKSYLTDFRGDAISLIAENISNKIHENIGEFSDGYHTFNELYEARMAYNVALFNEWASQAEYTSSGFEILPVKHDVHKSQRHHDGELCFGGGWFIVVANLPSGQISNHYEMKHWDLFRVPAVEKAKYEWDGHTSEDVINRLKSL